VPGIRPKTGIGLSFARADFRHKRTQHWRTGRHFYDLDPRLVLIGHRLEIVPQPQYDRVALVLPLFLRDQFHAQIAAMRLLPQVIMPDHAVEVDRRRSARITQYLPDFGSRADLVSECLQRRVRPLDRGSLRQIDENLNRARNILPLFVKELSGRSFSEQSHQPQVLRRSTKILLD
jgi:hypothetical protein